MRKLSRTLAFVLVVSTLTTVWVAATGSTQQYTYQKDDIKYTVEFIETTLSTEQQEQVAYRLVYTEGTPTQTYGLMCTLFGHELTESKVGVITHKVFTYAPRCKREIYNVTICERCDYQTQTLSGTSYLDCCPEE